MRTTPLLLLALAACTWVDGAELASRMDLDADGIDGLVDCNDADPDIQEPTTWYRDTDGDGFGNAEQSRLACEKPAGFVNNGTGSEGE